MEMKQERKTMGKNRNVKESSKLKIDLSKDYKQKYM